MPPNSYFPPTDNTQPRPPAPTAPEGDNAAAVNVIRQKLSQIYEGEPDAREELQEAEAVPQRSKHQQFMHELSTSGRDFATIQTEWHNYYQNLPAREKHEVWQEFYASQAIVIARPAPAPLVTHAQPSVVPATQRTKQRAATHIKRQRDKRSAEEIRHAIKDKVSAGGKLETKHHVQSLLFGLGMGSLVLLIFLFSFFNEVVLAPFIQPSRAQAATPLIISSNTIAPTAQPEVIIPKINVEIPVDYAQTTTDESQIENALDSGVVHYPTTVRPGQGGNTAYFGHSSNNIFNKGKYKFAFVLLHTLVPGDTFYLTYNGQVFVYKVFSRTIVDPSDVGVLGPVAGHTATATLITCDPPGTSLHRLIVVGDQISPDPAKNTQAAAPTGVGTTSTSLPGNGPTLWSRIISTLAGKAVLTVMLVGAMFWTFRWITAPKRQLKRAGNTG